MAGESALRDHAVTSHTAVCPASGSWNGDGSDPTILQLQQDSFMNHPANSADISVCTYSAALDGVVFLLQTLLDAGFIFVRDEDETPPFLRFGIDGKLNGFDLEGEEEEGDAC